MSRRPRYEVILSRRTSRFTSWAIYDYKTGKVLVDPPATRDRALAERMCRELNAALDEAKP